MSPIVSTAALYKVVFGADVVVAPVVATSIIRKFIFLQVSLHTLSRKPCIEHIFRRFTKNFLDERKMQQEYDDHESGNKFSGGRNRFKGRVVPPKRMNFWKNS